MDREGNLMSLLDVFTAVIIAVVIVTLFWAFMDWKGWY